MPDSITTRIEGLDRLGLALDRIPSVFATRILRGGLHAAGDVMGEAIHATEPYRTGALRDDAMVVKVYVPGDLRAPATMRVGPGYDRGKLTVQGVRRNKRGGIEAVVDTTESPGVYDKFVELGHRNGRRAQKNEKRESPREIEFGGGSTPPHPFMRPAYESSREGALAAFVAFARAGLDGVIAAAKELS